MDSSNGNTPLPEDMNKPPEGLVRPPKDIQAIVEKTAGYVSRNGPVFEDRVRDKEKNNPKFSFLNDGDAYAPFYQWRLTEIKNGRGTSIAAGRAGEATPAAEPEMPQGPPEPPAFHFSARMPVSHAQDLEVVKLTALFVAKRGKSWLTALSQREARNPQFEFLRPFNSLHQFFNRLVDQYTILLRSEGLDDATTEQKRIAELENSAKNKYHVLERAKQRADWVKHQELQKQEKEELEEQERIEYAQIDWHDFVVVETVVFTESDDHDDLPPPTSLNDLQSASLEQKAAMSLNPLRIEEAMPTDLDAPTYYNASPAQPQPVFAPQAPVSQYPAQYPAPYPQPGADYNAQYPHALPIQSQQPRPDFPAPAVPGQPPMRIRSDYVPRAQARRQQGATAICPNCHQQIPVAELDEHVRIELLDPRWKEQRAKQDARSATTNLSTADVVNNLKRLASQRSDVFDSSLAPGIDPEEEARRKRMALSGGLPDGPLPPGVAAPHPGLPIGPPGVHNPQNMNIEDQIRHIHQRARQ
ncbi:hypothetical protein N7466_006140 [Penicillium verhagenii]|uniref:uncharacterized protein n=1 Tax=Penicillium verhagenii TaxID=1562060 RepID=UPI002545833D|nr:uncharacterized protein N7466_006140 [Penicillium verhagenii]KAJ5930647.1 hypothetical protein N7466_006140 [Penicillium verhagenii]